MIEFTRANHLKISHHKYSESTDYNYTVTDIGEFTLPLKSSIDLAADAAKEFFEKNGSQPVNLFLSGGVDSECMLMAFLKAQLPFKIFVVEFNDKLNSHDIHDLAVMCKRHQVVPVVKQFDIINFYESGRHFDLAEKYLSRSPQFTAHFEFLTMAHGPSLMAWQPLKILLNAGVPQLVLPHDNYFSYCRFIDGAGLAASPFFFLYSPELIASFLKDDPLRKILNGDFDGQSYPFKIFQYQHGGFNITARADKYTGFELVKKYYKNLYPSQMDPFNEIYRFPLEKSIPIPYAYYRYSSQYLR